MRPMTTPSIVATGVSAPFPLDYSAGNPLLGIQVIVTGTMTYTVQVTLDDVFASTYVPASGNWFSIPVAALVAATTSQIATASGIYTGIRINVTATSGTVIMRVNPASNVGG